MVDKEMLGAISDLHDTKLEEKLEAKFEEKLRPVYEKFDTIDKRLDRVEGDVKDLKQDVRYVKVVQLENNIIPDLAQLKAAI